MDSREQTWQTDVSMLQEDFRVLLALLTSSVESSEWQAAKGGRG